jgi:aspartyl-tRNA(Asn)/glutamyl-tRNA(Gln) amidotransferase subunit B
MTYEVVIGIEIHTQLKTHSKLFSGAATAFGRDPNTQACAVDVAMPGTLPVLNKAVLAHAIRLAYALSAPISNPTIFARKNYFYPDLPKGYQISQLDHPIVGKGELEITLDDGTKKIIGVTRAHLEEDAGKSVHDMFPGQTGIDLNRAGTPLLEIVSEPDMRSAEEAIAYCKAMHQLVRFLGISDGNMQEGSFRADINISLRPKGQKTFGTRAEIKNLNSFRFIGEAIAYEINRQSDLLNKGEKVLQETRLYNPDTKTTKAMRSKEDAHDYRYFPDPDLLPITFDPDFLSEIKTTMPEMPAQKQKRLENDFSLSSEDARWLSFDFERAQFIDACLAISQDKKIILLLVGFMKQELSQALNRANVSLNVSPIKPADLMDLMANIENKTLSLKMAKTVLEALWSGEGSVNEIIAAKGLKQVDDEADLQNMISQVIAHNPTQAAEYKAGKTKMLSFFIGLIMRQTKGQANPDTVNRLLLEALE